MVSFGESPPPREPSLSPPAPYRPPADTRSPTPSPNRIGGGRSAHRDTAVEYDRAAAAAEQLGQRSAAAVRGGADGDVDGHLYYSLDEHDRRELAMFRDAQREAANGYGRDEAAGRVAVMPESAARRGSSIDVRALPYDDRRLDEEERRDLARLRDDEQRRINDSPERPYALSDVRARGSVGKVAVDVRKALDMLKIESRVFWA